MEKRASDLQVDVEDDEIVVTKPGARYLLAYRKSMDQPRLVMTRSWMGPTITAPGISEFRAKAFQAAVQKARELGWIT
jgi:hypothetical protein